MHIFFLPRQQKINDHHSLIEADISGRMLKPIPTLPQLCCDGQFGFLGPRLGANLISGTPGQPVLPCTVIIRQTLALHSTCPALNATVLLRRSHSESECLWPLPGHAARPWPVATFKLHRFGHHVTRGRSDPYARKGSSVAESWLEARPT
jgi:hypothetical protein